MRRHKDRRALREREWGQSWEVASALWDGPRTVDEVVAHWRSYLRFLGLFAVDRRLARTGHDREMRSYTRRTLDDLVDKGWAVREGDRYRLTGEGREEARKPLEDMRRSRARLMALTRPESVSKVSLGAHLGLAALKLPAGLLSGSVGLLNDAIDTALDGFSSLLVYAGLRFDRERWVNAVLVVLMLGTGLFSAYQAVRRVFEPVALEADYLTFAAALISAAVCAVLGFYQRLIGVRRGSLALITQSIDSRNHVIVAGGVTAGLIAALLDFPWLDVGVGLVVAGLILQSGVELAGEMLRSLGEGDPDLSRYRVGLFDRYAEFRHDQMAVWMLYLVRDREALSREALRDRAREALNFSDNPTLRGLGLAEPGHADVDVRRVLDDLFEKEWVAEAPGGVLTLTDAGGSALRKAMRADRAHAAPLVGGDRARHRSHRRERSSRDESRS